MIVTEQQPVVKINGHFLAARDAVLDPDSREPVFTPQYNHQHALIALEKSDLKTFTHCFGHSLHAYRVSKRRPNDLQSAVHEFSKHVHLQDMASEPKLNGDRYSSCLRLVKVYARLLDGIFVIPYVHDKAGRPVRFGLQFFADIGWGLGNTATALISFALFIFIPMWIGMPLWLRWRIIKPPVKAYFLGWVPFFGLIWVSQYKGNLQAARMVEEWLELLAATQNDRRSGDSEDWISERLAKILSAGLPSKMRGDTIEYPDKLRRKIWG